MVEAVTPPVVTPTAQPIPTASVTPPIPPSGLEPPKAPEPVVPPVDPAQAQPKDTAVALDTAKLTLPEGMKTDDPSFKSFGELIGATDMAPQERAQKLLDLYAGLVKSNTEASTAVWTKLNADWQEQVRNDKEIGGPNLDKTLATIKQVKQMPQFAVPGLDDALYATGAGNNPVIVKYLAKLSSAITEGGHHGGTPVEPAAAKSPASLLYPSMKG